MSENIELIEEIFQQKSDKIESPKLDGDNINYLKLFLNDEVGEQVRDNIFKNSFQSLSHFANPLYESLENNNNLQKILAVGKVQSGKTSFFISTIALAFDNGYNLAFLIGGTKNALRDQNFDRVEEYFQNNPNVLVYDINKVDSDLILNKLSAGYNVVLVILKNTNGNANLNKALNICQDCYTVPTLVVDDEGDEFTPGAPKMIRKRGRNGATHDVVSDIIYSFKNCTYLSVTATPQANFLISTIDSVSPDCCILVEPGEGYTGGNAFHDTLDNPHVVEILDNDDFIDSIPESFIDSLYFFIFALAYRRSVGDFNKYSMLVHPSSLTKVQNAVVDKINDTLFRIKEIFADSTNIAFDSASKRITDQISSYYEMNPGIQTMIKEIDIKKEIINVVKELASFEFNDSVSGKEDIERERLDSSLYKIYVGGNMLGRGLTIKNLIVTYMYRDSKVQAIDSLYQRARWLGYKASYFDVCRVYMTNSLKTKFAITVESENDMWESLRNFLAVDNDIKNFNRIFSLNDESGKLILTRPTISKTVTIERINPGFTYDKSIWFTSEAKIHNLELYYSYRKLHETDSYEKCFSTNEYQTHLIINTSFSAFYKEFLSKYSLPRGSKFGPIGFQKILRQIQNGEVSDDLTVIIMRYKTNEQRSRLCEGSLSIKELPQSYNESSKYAGDKNLPGFEHAMYFQIHMVYTDENNPDDLMPLLCFSNPLSQQSIKYFKYVTGDNSYGSI